MEACMGAYAYRGTESEDGKSRKTLETHPVPKVKIVLQLRGANGEKNQMYINDRDEKLCFLFITLSTQEKKALNTPT